MALLIGFLAIAVVGGAGLEWRARTGHTRRHRKTARGLANMMWVVAIVLATLMAVVFAILGDW